MASADFTAGASAMRGQVLALLDGYEADLARGLTKGYPNNITEKIAAQVSVIAEARGQIAAIEVQP